MLARAVCAVLTTAFPLAAAAAPGGPDVSTISLGISGVAGLEDKPGVAAGLEASAGYRFRPRTSWHVRAWWAPAAGRFGGGGEDQRDHEILELRTGPTWWTCSVARCLGASTEAGLQRLRSDQMGVGDDGTAYDRTLIDYAAVLDGRFRLRLGPTRLISVELAAGLRLKARITGDSLDSRTGGGFLFSAGVTGNF